jgi:deoxyadenosine/deoxycytidine kinase
VICGDKAMNSTNDQLPYRYVVIEGPIGVGKTTLAKRLAERYQADLLLEQAEDNPFLERFYKNPRQGAFPAQLFFLFQRSQQLKELRQSDLFSSTRISDFLLEKDQLFARMNLDSEEFSLYTQIYDRLAIEAPKPDLVVYLQAPVGVLQERIARRGVSYELGMDKDYLKRVVDSYTQFFHMYDSTPLLIVNVTDINWVDNAQHFEELLNEILKPRRGRHYFNPHFG